MRPDLDIHDPPEQGNNPRDRLRQRHDSPARSFARSLRADQRLSATARLAWHMTALSATPAGYTMSAAHTAQQLKISERMVRTGIHRLVVLGLFTRKKTGRQTSYQRTERKDFARKCRTLSELDLTVRLLWLIVDIASAGDGSTSKSLAELGEQLNALRQNVWRAAQQLEAFGFITTSEGCGVPNRYALNTALPLNDIADATDHDGLTIDQYGEPVIPAPAEQPIHIESYAEFFRSQEKGRRR